MAEGVVGVSDNTFEAEVIKAEVPTLVDFWAEWCGPCRKVGPIIEELAGEYAGTVKFVKLDVDNNTATPVKYGIMSIPTLILFKGGKLVDKIIGARGKSDYKTWIDARIG